MITAQIAVFATGSRQDEILRTLRWLGGQLEGEPGLEQVDLYKSLDREDKVVLVQRWRTLDELARFVRSDTFFRLLEVLELSQEAPEIRFDTVSERQGLELVEDLRKEASMSSSE